MMAGSQSDAECNNSGGTHTEKKTDNRQTCRQTEKETKIQRHTQTERDIERQTTTHR